MMVSCVVKVSCEERVSDEVSGEGSVEWFGERSCECQAHFVVKVEMDHSEGVVEVGYFVGVVEVGHLVEN